MEKPARDGRLPGTVEPGGAGGARAGSVPRQPTHPWNGWEEPNTYAICFTSSRMATRSLSVMTAPPFITPSGASGSRFPAMTEPPLDPNRLRYDAALAYSDCQWQPKTAHFWSASLEVDTFGWKD